MRTSSLSSSRAHRFLITGAAAGVLALGTLAGCTTAPQEASEPSVATSTERVAPLDERSSSAGVTDENTVTSTALVVYVGDDEAAFVDQDNGALYIPTLPDDRVFGLDGREIDEDALRVGDVVSVTGNGIMLESYPGQYPGISKVQVISEGDAAEAEKYADEVAAIFGAADAGNVATGTVEYTTTLGQVSLPLTAYASEWRQADGSTREIDSEYHDRDGVLVEGTPDARINAPTEVTVTFSSTLVKLEVERTPVSQTPQGTWAIERSSHDEKVMVTNAADKSATFVIEPGYVYELDADFGQDNEASYAFVALN